MSSANNIHITTNKYIKLMTANTKTTAIMTSSMATLNSSCTQTHFNKFMIVTPVVLIDRNYTRSVIDDQYNNAVHSVKYNPKYDNGIFYTERDKSISAIRRCVNTCSKSTTTNLLSENTTTASWRWCALIFEAIRCFGESN